MKHTEAEYVADRKLARRESIASRDYANKTPAQIRLEIIVHRNLVERRQAIRAKRQAQIVRDHEKLNCLGDAFAAIANMKDFA